MTSLLLTIQKHMARTLFVTTYADAVDNGEIKGRKAKAGEDWNSIAPKTPLNFGAEAWMLIGRIEQLNGKDMLALFAAACKANNVEYTLVTLEDKILADFGHYLAMESLGHGVSFFDDYNEFPLELPLIEVHF